MLDGLTGEHLALIAPGRSASRIFPHVAPRWLLAAQVVVNFVLAVVAMVVIVASATLFYHVPAPAQLGGFVLSALLATAALFSIGLFIAAVAANPAVAAVSGTVLFYALMFFAGLYIPRQSMSPAMRHISDYTSLGAGVHAMLSSMQGAFPPARPLVMAAWAVVSGLAAVKLFRTVVTVNRAEDLRPLHQRTAQGRRHASPPDLTAVFSAWHTSVMSITPRRPAASATGRWRRCLAVMMVAASRMLVVVVTAGRVIVTAWTRTSLGSFPFAIARAMSAWVMMPVGWPVCASVTMRAVVPACFIRYAAAATWSYCPAVVGGGRMMSVTVAAAARGLGGGFRAGAVVVVCFISGS